MRKVPKSMICLFIGAILSLTMLDARAVHGQQAPPLKDETASSSPVVPADHAPRKTLPDTPSPPRDNATTSSNTERLTRAERDALSERIDRAASKASGESREVSTGYGGLLLQMIISLGIVCVLAYVLLRYGLKRLLPDQNKQGQMQVLARLPLEPRRTLLVVKVGEKVLVLASSEAGVHPVSELTLEEASSFLEDAIAEGADDSAKAARQAFSLSMGEDSDEPVEIKSA